MCSKKISVFFVCVGSLFTIVSMPGVQAHGDGASYEEDKAGYRIDVGYSPEIPKQNQTTRFDFLLFAKTGQTYERFDFSDVWVTITKDDVRYFAGPIHRSGFGDPGFQFYFADSGTYDITVRYQSGTDRVVETTFPLEVQSLVGVEDDVGYSENFQSAWGFLGLFAFLSVLFLVLRKKIRW